MAHMTITCPVCKGPVRVDVTLAGKSEDGKTVMAYLDKSAADEHLKACRGVHGDQDAEDGKAGTELVEVSLSEAELTGRVHRLLDMRAYITAGKRTCTLCGTAAQDCLVALEQRQPPCCNGCRQGNTHPVPQGDLTCAEWAETHGAGRG